MLDILRKHKLIGGSGGRNTLTYLENTDEDFNTGELVNVESVEGVLRVKENGQGYRISPKIKAPDDLLSSEINWDGEGAISLIETIKEGEINNDTLLILHGDQVKDVSPNPKTLTTPDGEVSIVDGKFNKAFTFGKSIKIPTSEIRLDFTTSFTVDWWQYLESQTSNEGVLSTKMSQYGFLLGYVGSSSTKNITYYLSSNGTSWNIADNIIMGEPKFNEWVHRAFVFDKNSRTIYTFENGIKTGSKVLAAGTVVSCGQELSLLKAWSGSMTGKISEFRISNKPLWNSDFTPLSRPYESSETQEKKLNKKQIITHLPREFKLKESVKNNETISDVKLEMKSKLEKVWRVPAVQEDTSKVYLYRQGDMENTIVKYTYTGINNTTFDPDKITVCVPSGTNGAGVRTSTMLDLTPYTKLYVEGKNVTGDTFWFYLSKDPKIIPNKLTLGSIQSKESTLMAFDISNYNDSFYVGEYQNGDLGERKNCIYNIWLEK